MSDPTDKFRTILDPVRMTAYEVLLLEGPSSEAELLKVIPQLRSSVAAELEVMAAAGFVRRLDDDRWEAIRGALYWTGLGDQISDHIQAELERVVTERRIARLRQWAGSARTGEWSEEWRSAEISIDMQFYASSAMLDELGRDLLEVLKKHRDRAAEDTTPMDKRVPIWVTASGFPYNLGVPY